ncbi:MAG: ROK family protein [Planctomycetaceae bacterium]
MTPYVVGIDLGGTKTLATVYDAEFEPLASRMKKTLPHEGFDACVRRIADTVEQALRKASVDFDRVAAIGVGSPGSLDLDAGVILDAPNLGWTNAPLAGALQKRFECSVAIGNDVDMGVFAENSFGAARGSRCVIGVFPGTGIGGGCVYEGRVLRGGRGSCMEIGHVPVMPDGPECGCGQLGCLEAIAGRLAIAAAAARAAHCGQAPYLMEHAGTVVSRIRAPMIAKAIRNGDAAVERIVRRAARAVGLALAGAIHMLAPDTVVLGGGVVEELPEVFLPEVERAARERVLPSFRDGFRVVKTELGGDATALGAAAWAAESVVREQGSLSGVLR